MVRNIDRYHMLPPVRELPNCLVRYTLAEANADTMKATPDTTPDTDPVDEKGGRAAAARKRNRCDRFPRLPELLDFIVCSLITCRCFWC